MGVEAPGEGSLLEVPEGNLRHQEGPINRPER
jgi:hypothetical protein